jgi:magnesium-transporting ATPase (P-type)
VKVEKDEEVPADLLLISAPKDVVFVSTMNLDGETNLKDRELAVTSVESDGLAHFYGQVVCDHPSASLDTWDGNLSSAQLGRVRACGIKNLMLRGCTLKNIPHAYGIVLYVGDKTKIFMNSKKASRKISGLMKLMNKMLYTVFAFQLLIVALYSILALKWNNEHSNHLHYLNTSNYGTGVVSFIIQYFTYWVAYSHMIPISLYVIIEMLKLLQAKLINNDVKMFFVEDM